MKNILLAAVICCGLVAHVPVHGGVERDLLRLLGAYSLVVKVGKVARVAVPVLIVGAIVGCVIKARAKKQKRAESVFEIIPIDETDRVINSSNPDTLTLIFADLAARRQKEEASKK